MRTVINTYNKISPYAHIKIEPFDINKRYTKPHRHNKYLELVYFRKGSGLHHMDLKRYRIEPPVVFVIRKDQVHHWEINTLPEGFVIIIKEEFLERTLDKKINHQLGQLNQKQVIDVGPDATIDSLFELLCRETKQNTSGQNEVIEGSLKALLAKILSYAITESAPFMGDKLSQFNTYLGKQLKNDVSYYAKMCNTTSQNLNALCQKEYSKTASKVIAIHIIKEAKRLLNFTDLSVTEIAFKLNFKDVSHFVKYFKRHEGKTPIQFKKRQ
ncbi:helix-turn-helix domain-containing protein [Ulvibacterium sp.]|uniref:helix-turn-helix domain-containing protein n=1 Tax=Ulvibacterium sp. TaxID=2665914 RepID=UPI003BAB4F2E